MLQVSWCISDVWMWRWVFKPCRVGFDHAAWCVSFGKLTVYWKTGNCHNM